MKGWATLGGAILLLALVAGAGRGLIETRQGTPPGTEPACAEGPRPHPITGVSFVAPARPVQGQVMAPVRRVGADWVAILPYGFVAPGEAHLRFDQERQWWGERVEGVAEQIRLARAAGLRVAVKPHVWIRGSGWTGDFLPAGPEDRQTWEASYRNYILTFARLAAETDADLFVVGTELDRFARERAGFWRDLIRTVRAIYPGPITYAANWDAFHQIPFWDDLDYIGVDAYFPLSNAATPTVEELVAAWEPWLRKVDAVCRRFARPVLFTEYGYRSIDGAAGRQWELPPERRRDIQPNLAAQANAYEALFRVWWDRPWFAGGFLWKWFPEYGARARSPGADYTPQGKPVEEVILRWHQGIADGS